METWHGNTGLFHHFSWHLIKQGGRPIEVGTPPPFSPKDNTAIRTLYRTRALLINETLTIIFSRICFQSWIASQKTSSLWQIKMSAFATKKAIFLIPAISMTSLKERQTSIYSARISFLLSANLVPSYPKIIRESRRPRVERWALWLSANRKCFKKPS